MQAIVALVIIGLIIYGYIKAWIWLGGKIGEAVDKALDRRNDNQTQLNNSVSMAVLTNQKDRGTYFDKVLYDIQRKKRRGTDSG